MILRRPHLCWRCLSIALGILAGFLSLAHADAKVDDQKVASTAPANAGVPDDLPDFNQPAPQVAAASPILKDHMDMQAEPTNINKDTGIFLYGDSKSTKSANN